MSEVAAASSGKSHQDENFPVAALLGRRYRAPVLAFYNFVRAADDVADHATLAPERKLALLDGLARALTGQGPSDPVAEPLKQALSRTRVTDRHALDLIEAFKLDVTKNRYRDFDDLVDYCRLSAMPVGRYVLDLHGESRDTWVASDKLCAALQIINHLQDCGKDYRNLNRVYLPRNALAAAGASVEMLGRDSSPPALLACLHDLARRTEGLLDDGRSLSAGVKDIRLGIDVAVIQAYADKIVQLLKVRDPLSERVHLKAHEFFGHGMLGIAGELTRRMLGRGVASKRAAGA